MCCMNHLQSTFHQTITIIVISRMKCDLLHIVTQPPSTILQWFPKISNISIICNQCDKLQLILFQSYKIFKHIWQTAIKRKFYTTTATNGINITLKWFGLIFNVWIDNKYYFNQFYFKQYYSINQLWMPCTVVFWLNINDVHSFSIPWVNGNASFAISYG